MATTYYRPFTAEPSKESLELPSHDALASILPDYRYTFLDHHPLPTTSQPHASTDDAKDPPNTSDVTPGPNDLTQAAKELETHRLSRPVIDQLFKELDNYRTAVQKMGQDILSLREKLRDSEVTNSKLRSDLARYDDTTKLMFDSAELDGITKPELAGRYASLKVKISSQNNELQAYKDKVCHLQNKIIKKNDDAKDFISVRAAHQSQQRIIHKLQERVSKITKLENTCRKQEQIIQKLEKLVEKSKNSKTADLSAEAKEVLLQENKRLRDELFDAKEQLTTTGANTTVVEDSHLLELHQSLEKSDGRIVALEKQIEENARCWGKEKAELLLHLQEAERGFRTTVGISDAYTGRFIEPYRSKYLRDHQNTSIRKNLNKE